MKVLTFILLLIYSSCFLVYEKIPLNTYFIKVRKELKEICALHTLEKIEYDDYIYKKNDSEYILSSVKAKALFFNSYMLNPDMANSSETIINFSWNSESESISPYHSIYTAVLGSNKEQYNIEFELEVSNFVFSKHWELYSQDNFYIPSGSITNWYISFKVKKLDKNCPYNEELLLEIINKFLNENKDKMNEAFNNGIKSYYTSLPLDELSQKIYINTDNNPKENNLDMTLEEKPEFESIGNNDGFIIFKRKATLNGKKIEGSPIIQEETKNQRFNINQDLFIILLENNIFTIEFDQSNNPSPLYELTVEYLKKVISIDTILPDNTDLKISAAINGLGFEEGNPLNGLINYDINITSKEDSKFLFNFEFEIDFTFIPTLFHRELNFVLLGKNLQNINCYDKTHILNENLLKEWIDNTFKCALGNKEYNLFYNSFDLSKYFNSDDLSFEYLENYLSIKQN